MANEVVKLRGHHLVSLVLGRKTNYVGLEEGLRKWNGGARYTEQDAVCSSAFYRGLIPNPQRTIEVVRGIDDRCRMCSNYDPTRNRCRAYSEAELDLEDERSLAEFFPGLKVGEKVRVRDFF